MTTIRANAMLWKPPTVKSAVHDGDTYWFLVDIKNNAFRNGAIVCDCRLFGFSAVEIGGAADAQRVSGHDARLIAEKILTAASKIEVEFMGRDKYGRDVAQVYVDGNLLGPMLAKLGAVVAGSFKGLHGPEFAAFDADV